MTGNGHNCRALSRLEAPLSCPYPGGSSLPLSILPGVELEVDFVGFCLFVPKLTPVAKDMNIKHTWKGICWVLEAHFSLTSRQSCEVHTAGSSPCYKGGN